MTSIASVAFQHGGQNAVHDTTGRLAAMIARVWKARTSNADLSSYRAHLQGKVLPVLQDLAGYQGAKLLTHTDGGEVEILVVTWWTSLDSIRAFAGIDVERAVVDPEVRPLLSAWDDRVTHYEVALDDEP